MTLEIFEVARNAQIVYSAHCLLDQLQMTERIVARFRKHPTMSITHKWRAESESDASRAR